MGQRRLADTGDAFNQQVAAREYGNQRQAQDFIIAADDRPQGLLNRRGARAAGG
jgi:hypothetical protein